MSSRQKRRSAADILAQAPSSPVAVPERGDSMKLDHGKAPWHLAPWDAFLAIVHVLAFGAQKYRARGWEEGMGWERVYAAAMRHLTDWFMRVDKGRGPGRDKDTGYSDLWHAGCCVCFLIAYEIREGHGQHDSRPHVRSDLAQFFPPLET